jgi:hypothetical protein
VNRHASQIIESLVRGARSKRLVRGPMQPASPDSPLMVHVGWMAPVCCRRKLTDRASTSTSADQLDSASSSEADRRPSSIWISVPPLGAVESEASNSVLAG